jgi:hypothetical protein
MIIRFCGAPPLGGKAACTSYPSSGQLSKDSYIPATGRWCIAWFARIITFFERCAKHERPSGCGVLAKPLPSTLFGIAIEIGVGVGIGVEKEVGMAFGHEKLARCSRNSATGALLCRRAWRIQDGRNRPR